MILSMSQSPLSDEEHNAAVMKPLRDTPVRYWDILNQTWLNFTPEDQSYWHDIIVLDHTVQYKGSILSRTRQQIEITLLFSEPRPCGAERVRFCITLANFDQYLWEDEE